jgi:GR25 family glycosyltransferase involved in LPS biosynthesis
MPIVCHKRVLNGASLEEDGPAKRPKIAVEVEPKVAQKEVAENRCEQTKTASTSSITIDALETVLVNLDRRPDRLQECSTRLASNCPGLRWKRLAAVDGKREAIETSMASTAWHTGRNAEYQKIRALRKGWNDLDQYKSRTLFMSAGERGCAMSHIRAWQICAKHPDDKPLLVLEDDAEPVADFNNLFKQCMETLPQDADILYLGYSQAAPWRREVGHVLVEAEYVWTTVAYMIWPSCARALLRRVPVDQPVDNWLACLSADEAIKSYCARPKLVRQAGEWNVNSDVRHSDEFYWGSDSNILHSDHLYWGNPTPLTGDTQAKGSLINLDEETSDEESEDGF